MYQGDGFQRYHDEAGTFEQRKELEPITLLTPGSYTLYTVLGKVIAHVQAEPKRLNMRSWVEAFQSQSATEWGPACGTVACMAGWGAILTNHRSEPDGESFLRQFTSVDSGRRASEAINEGDESPSGYAPMIYALYRLFFTAQPLLPRGSREYAQNVARRFETFRQKHKRQLQRWKCEVMA